MHLNLNVNVLIYFFDVERKESEKKGDQNGDFPHSRPITIRRRKE